MNRRTFLVTSAAALGRLAFSQQPEVPESIRNLKPMTAGIKPITEDERRERLAKARRLMAENNLAAILMEGGSSLYYFTGLRIAAGEGSSAWILPAKGEPVFIASKAGSGREAGSNPLLGETRSLSD